MLSAAAVAICTLFSCDSVPSRVVDEDLGFSFAAPGELLSQASEGERVRWNFEDGVVTRERIERTSYNESASLREVAEALATRHDPEPLAVAPCRLAGMSAQCLTGEVVHNGKRFHRDSVLLSLGEDLVWLTATTKADEARAFTSLVQDFRFDEGNET